jgi:glycerophosphoryl diester phosphodiesterase
MRKAILAAALLAFTVGQAATSETVAGDLRAGAPSRIAEIRERLQNANRWRDHVMVVAHRGGGLAQRASLFPENSIAAVRDAIGLGAEMVELDVQKSADGVFVVFHDSWLDRTSTCRGEVAKRTISDLRRCRLVIEGTGEVTGEPIPTLAEMLEVTRGKIFVNVDNKLEPADLPAIVAVGRAMGVEDEVVIKANIWDDARIAKLKDVLSAVGHGPVFMPIIADDAVRDAGLVETVTSAFDADAAELISWHKGGEPMTSDGGPLFGARARAVAARGDWHLWVNTYAIVNKPAGMLSGGRGDQLATVASMPAEAFGFWVDRGATIIQTDEPKAAIEWLEANGYRVPYRQDPVETAGTN